MKPATRKKPESPEPALPARPRAALSKTLEDFVLSAIADTRELSPDAGELIKNHLFPLYAHYRPNPPYIVDSLDTLGDTEEVRHLEAYFRETLVGYTTGWNDLNHLYYALKAVYIGFVNEYVRIGRENYKPDIDQAVSVTQSARMPPNPEPATLNNELKHAPIPSLPQEPDSTQIGLFG